MIPVAIIVAGALISISCDNGNDNNNLPLTGDLQILTTELASWVEGNSGSATVSATGGTKPYSWAFKSFAEIPPWLNPQIGNSGPPSYDGIIRGTAPLLAPGSTRSISPPFAVICTDARGRTATKQFTITIIKPHPTITTIPGTMCVGKTYSYQSSEFPCIQIATATGGTPPYRFQSDTFRNGVPPPQTAVGTQFDGMTQNGCLTGMASTTGTYNFGVTVVDSVGQQDSKQVTVNVVDCPEPATYTIIVQSSFNCLLIAESEGTLYSGSSFAAIPVKEHGDICFRVLSSPIFPEDGVQCPEPTPTPTPTTRCVIYVDSSPVGFLEEYCFTDVTEDHIISASSQ